MGKVNTFETPEMHLYFDSDLLDRCLKIIFVGSFPYFKFFTKINSKVKRKYPAKVWPIAGCFGRLPALIDSPATRYINEFPLTTKVFSSFADLKKTVFDDFSLPVKIFFAQ